MDKVAAMLKEWKQALRLGLVVKPLKQEQATKPFKDGPLPPATVKPSK